MMLAVEFADFGFGTVVGAVVAGSIAIFLDQRRRKDEKKRLFLEEKRLMYRSVIQSLELLDEQIILYSKFVPYFKEVEEFDEEGQQLVQEVRKGFRKTLAEARSRYDDHLVDFSLLSSRQAAHTAKSAAETLRQILACIEMDEPCNWSFMQVIFEAELQNLRFYVRQDLGTDA
jgi:hypothetical protein